MNGELLVQQIHGYSGVKTLELLNRFVSMMDPALIYLEVGSMNGLSVAGALLDNEAKAVCIDNFSDYKGSEAGFRSTMNQYGLQDRVRLINSDFETVFVSRQLLPFSAGVYLYDGSHTEEDQYKGLCLAEPFLCPKATVVIDDMNWEATRRPTEKWVAQHGLNVLNDLNSDGYGNGILVCQWK